MTRAAPSAELPASALSVESFAFKLEGLIDHSTTIAVGVSGGADSVALVLLAQAWARQNNCELTALTVDHQLRMESTAEAQKVHAWMAARGIAHETLTWDEGQTLRHINRSAQDDARQARLSLLTQWCKAHGAGVLLLAHHADDQIETFFMRLARGSGVQGLSAMLPVTMVGDVRVVRPLLDVAKADLVATCQAFGQAWIEDPSNDSAKYARARFRKARAFLEAEGFSRQRILATIAHQRRAHEAVRHAVDVLARDAVMWTPYGTATVAARCLRGAPEEVQLRLLSALLQAVSGQYYGPRFESLDRLRAKLGGDLATATLHGCAVARAGDIISISREPSAVREIATLEAGATLIWDGRFELHNATPSPLRVRVLMADDQSWWRANVKPETLAVPARVRRSLPVLEDSDGVLGVPSLSVWRTDAHATPASINCRFVGCDRLAHELVSESHES
jgi:tRNA(Ile)-lysidine synthase